MSNMTEWIAFEGTKGLSDWKNNAIAVVSAVTQTEAEAKAQKYRRHPDTNFELYLRPLDSEGATASAITSAKQNMRLVEADEEQFANLSEGAPSEGD